MLGIGDMYGRKSRQVHDAPGAIYACASEAATRLARFLAMWDARKTPEDVIWLEQHMKRTVAEYKEWLDRQGEGTPDLP